MKTFIKGLLSFIVVNLFFFSSRYYFTGNLNTKEILAVFGAAFFLYDVYFSKQRVIPKELLYLLIYSVAISLMVLFSTTIHISEDTSYKTYFISMLTWLGGAYGSVRFLKVINGEVNLKIICKYIVYTAVAQCVVAFLADRFPAVDVFINSMTPGFGWVKSVDRLYGFSETACLDTGGIRFAIASVLCMHLLKHREYHCSIPLFILFFCIICVAGNMVARTTTVGTLIGLVYLMLPRKGAPRLRTRSIKIFVWFSVIIGMTVLAFSVLSSRNRDIEKRMRFAFEGFYSLVEEGRWQTGSNDKLKSMYVFPDNLETWIIGDGYFANPAKDLNYVGEITEGYYKNTDVGYLRFIFYIGIIGLALFSAFIIYSGKICVRQFPEHRMLFIILTSMNFVIWFKVATDCFFILAYFIALAYVRNHISNRGRTRNLPEY